MDTTLIVMTLIIAITFFMSVALFAYVMLKLNNESKKCKHIKHNKIIHDWDKRKHIKHNKIIHDWDKL